MVFLLPLLLWGFVSVETPVETAATTEKDGDQLLEGRVTKQRSNAAATGAARVRLRTDLALLPLDDELVVFCDFAQSLIGLNASAAFVFRKLQSGASASELEQALVSEGLTTPEEAERWVATTLDTFGSHGMLDDGRPPTVALSDSPDEGQERAASRIAKMPPYAPFKPALEKRYRLLGTNALIRFAMWDQVDRVDAVMGHLTTDEKSEPTVIVDIQGSRLHGHGPVRSYIYRDGEPINFTTGLHRLAPVVKSALWQSAVNAHDFLLYVHAGVVGMGETCILLPAAAGSGKSSLTAALTHKGFRYFSDEVALIERNTFRVPPVPLAICVKRTGWDVIARYYPEIRGLINHERMDDKVVRYVPPPAAAIQRASAPVSHIIFPRYEPEGPTKLKPVKRSEALRRLLDECLASKSLDRESVTELIRWIEGIDCYELTFSSLDQAIELVTQAVDLR